MINFLLYNTYTRFWGKATIVLGGCNLAFGAWKLVNEGARISLPYFAVAMAFLIGIPVMLKGTADSQVKKANLEEATNYELTEEGVRAIKNEQIITVPWTDFTKVISMRQSIVMYRAANRIFLFPKEDLGTQEEDVVAAIRAHVDAEKVKIKCK